MTEGRVAGIDAPGVRVLLFVAVLIGAEAAILLRHVELGVVVHGAALLGLLLVIGRGAEHQRVYEAMAFVPLLRVLNLGASAVTFSPFLWLGGVYLLLLLGLGVLARDRGVTLRGLGLGDIETRRDVGVILAGAAVGILLGGVQWSLKLEAPVADPTFTNTIVKVLTAGFIVGFTEEILFRGLLQRWMEDVTGPVVAILAVSLLFGFMHSVWMEPLDVAFAFLVSLLLGSVYSLTRSFWFIATVHSFINITAWAMLPLLTL